MKKIFFPGSFNPFTRGHADIVCRLLTMSETVVVGIGKNIDKPESHRAAEENAESIREWAAANSLSDKVYVTIFSGLTGEEALRLGASVIARGVRNATDFDYEYTMATANRLLFNIETILIPASPELSSISSTLVRDLRAHGRDDLAQKLGGL